MNCAANPSFLFLFHIKHEHFAQTNPLHSEYDPERGKSQTRDTFHIKSEAEKRSSDLERTPFQIKKEFTSYETNTNSTK